MPTLRKMVGTMAATAENVQHVGLPLPKTFELGETSPDCSFGLCMSESLSIQGLGQLVHTCPQRGHLGGTRAVTGAFGTVASDPAGR